jgi:S1-C subfamily serine protease
MLVIMNWLDLIILVLLITAIIRGKQVGLLHLLLSSLGFITGLLLGSWVSKHVAGSFATPASKLAAVLIIEFGLAFTLAALGELASVKLHRHAVRWRLDKVNSYLGAVFEIVFTLAIVWLGASALGNVRSYDIGQEIKQSWTISKLNSTLPTPPDVLARLEKIISPNGFPDVFLGLEPRHTTISPNNSVSNQAVLTAEKSVVKIQGVGCGGIVNGSGFVVDKGVVVTNAHVVAGIARPQVVNSTGTYRAAAIWFDPNLDIAILRVPTLPDPGLDISGQVLPDNEGAAVLGFPGGGPLVAQNAAIIDHIAAAGRNIYNQGIVFRNIYEVQADVEPGNSGGPLLAPDGSVAGVIFAKSVSQNNLGYALLINQVQPLINKAEQQNTVVGTGNCAQD